MRLKGRTCVVCSFGILALAIYWMARSYSPTLVAHVVEQTLIQKAPEDMAPEQARRRFRGHLESFPAGQVRVERLLTLSQRLEKVQRLTHSDLEQLLKVDGKSAQDTGR